MSAKFYVISLGPGKPELITLQALKTLEKCERIFVQTRSKELTWKGSVAYKILNKLCNSLPDFFYNLPESNEIVNKIKASLVPVYTPMRYDKEIWDNQVNQIIESFNKYDSVGYVTIGDAGVHSSAYYLLQIIKTKSLEVFNNTEIIPGVSSFNYAAALVKKPLCLGDTTLEVIPKRLENTSKTKVYMRLHKGDDTSTINGNNFFYFKNLGMDNEIISQGTPGVIDNYLTLLIDFAEPDNPNC